MVAAAVGEQGLDVRHGNWGLRAAKVLSTKHDVRRRWGFGARDSGLEASERAEKGERVAAAELPSAELSRNGWAERAAKALNLGGGQKFRWL